MNYLMKLFNPVPQSEPIAGKAMVRNSAGGYSFGVDDWTRMSRFLILGCEGATFYATERQLLIENATAVERCIAADGPRVVRELTQISTAGRAPRNDPAILALAMCFAKGDLATKVAARQALPAVCRTGTHLFTFVAMVDAMRSWGRGLRNAVASWYNGQPPRQLALQLVKYQQRNGWSHRDVLRLSHAHPATPEHGALFRWAVKGELESPADLPPILDAVRRLHGDVTLAQAVDLVREHRLPREAVPTHLLKERDVWAALLESMPMHAMVRNLATMTRVGLLAPLSDAAKTICARLGDADAIKGSRLHPIALLSASKVYHAGHGVRGGNTWTPVPAVVNALDEAFYLAFGNVAPTGKRWVLGLDVSGSMGAGMVGGVVGLTPRVASAAMAMVTLRTERAGAHVMAFSTSFVPLALSPSMSLAEVVAKTGNLPFGGTDCAQPMLWALKNRVQADVFVVYTDSETWAGPVHPVDALRQYRRKTGIDARLIVVGMVSNGFTIADPTDRGMLDVVGFDASAPELMAAFARGEV